METLWQDFYYGIRMLVKHKGFTAAAILSLAIGIGANSAIFSVTNALLLRPLTYTDAERLVILWSRSPGLNVAQDWFSPGQFLDVKTQNEVFEHTAVAIGASFNLTGDGAPEHIDGARVSSSFFPVFGTKVLLGRELLPEEDEPGKPQTVILSHGFWQRRFGGDPEILNKTLLLNDSPFIIVGVMPAGFSLTKEVMPAVNGIEKADLLLPLPMNEAARSSRTNEDYNIFGKLKPGVTVARAQAEMNVIAGRMKEQYPANYPPNGGLTISVVPLLEQVVGDIGQALPILLGAVGFVLLIACANVANLLLARATVRQKEIAIRTAVGASRLRIFRQLLTESVALALTGGLIGLGLALAAVKALRLFAPENIPRLHEITVDVRVMGFTFAVALLTGMIFGLVPALRASRVDLNESLKDGGRNAGAGAAGRKHQNLRKLLVISEVALSLVLLIGAGLLIRSYRHIVEANPGFNPRNLLSMRLSLPATRYPKAESIQAFFQQAQERLKQMPGVETAGISFSLPLSTAALAWEPVKIEGYVPQTADEMILANVRIVSPEYFPAMGVGLVEGRLFNEHDRKGEMESVIINEALAKRFWADETPIGKRLQRSTSGQWRTVVGVIRDAKEYSADKEPPIGVYYPTGQISPRNMFMLVRTTSDPAPMAAALVQEIQTLDSQLPVFEVYTMEQRLSESLARRRFSMILLGIFALIALLLAGIGIYGVISYSVNQRTHEIGIRMALGAQPGNILHMVLRQALILVSAGIALGLTGAFILMRVLSSLLYGVSHTDSYTFIFTPLLLGSIALLASFLPARRAAKVNPMVALRYE
jgi:predicted permease